MSSLLELNYVLLINVCKHSHCQVIQNRQADMVENWQLIRVHSWDIIISYRVTSMFAINSFRWPFDILEYSVQFYETCSPLKLCLHIVCSLLTLYSTVKTLSPALLFKDCAICPECLWVSFGSDWGLNN